MIPERRFVEVDLARAWLLERVGPLVMTEDDLPGHPLEVSGSDGNQLVCTGSRGVVEPDHVDHLSEGISIRRREQGLDLGIGQQGGLGERLWGEADRLDAGERSESAWEPSLPCPLSVHRPDADDMLLDVVEGMTLRLQVVYERLQVPPLHFQGKRISEGVPEPLQMAAAFLVCLHVPMGGVPGTPFLTA